MLEDKLKEILEDCFQNRNDLFLIDFTESTINKAGSSLQMNTPKEIVSKYKITSVPVKAGDGLCMHSNLVHKSGDNTSTKIRFTLLVRFNIITTNDFFLKSKMDI